MYKLNKLKIVRKFKNFDEFEIESIREKQKKLILY